MAHKSILKLVALGQKMTVGKGTVLLRNINHIFKNRSKRYFWIVALLCVYFRMSNKWKVQIKSTNSIDIVAVC